jgi:Glycosyltransferase family 87
LVVGLWTTRAIADHSVSDQFSAWNAGFATWHDGHPERFYTWTGTPVYSVVAALESQTMSLWTSTVCITLLSAVITLALVAALVWRLRATVARPWRWLIAVALVSFAPLLSTVWWKQINLIPLALGLVGFDLVRRAESRSTAGSALIGLSVAFKPLLILLPFVLAGARDTRRAGLEAIGWLAGSSMAALAFVAWRAHSVAVLSPWRVFHNFANKSDPVHYSYIASSDNFAPLSVLLRLGGTSRWREDELLVLVLLALAGAWTVRALRGYGMRSWQAFGFVGLLSAMGSTIDWNHYGVLMAPLFVVLVVDMSRGHASALDWVGLALAFGLASLVWRPYGTMPGNLHSLLRTGHLPPLDGYIVTAGPTESIAQCGQYVLVVVGLLWYSRRPSRAAA